jgi:hypothetical protein
MSGLIGLRIGESFAEIRAFSSDTLLTTPVYQSRWYRPKRPLSEVLKEMFTALESDEAANTSDGGTIYLTISSQEKALQRHRGSTPAFVVTSGFESWLAERQPLVTPLYSLEPEKAWLPLESERIFGLSERVLADGKIEKALELSELEALAIKFEALKIKSIAIGFINSTANPEHEIQASTYFRERGFKVVTSNETFNSIATESEFEFQSEYETESESKTNEVNRWRLTLERALFTPTIEQERLEILAAFDEALGENRTAWSILLVGNTETQQIADAPASSFRGGFLRSLQNYFKLIPRVRSSRGQIILHFGLEGFYLLCRQTPDWIVHLLPLQPTQAIALSGWQVPTFTNEDRGYEPGPMLFGRSHNLALVDLLFALEQLNEIEGFSSQIGESIRTRARIFETLYTMSKSSNANKNAESIDPHDVATDLDLAAIERIAMELARYSAKGEILLSGAMAGAFKNKLKRRRPDLQFTSIAGSIWIESDACLFAELQS